MAERITTFSAETARAILDRLAAVERKQHSLLSGGMMQSFPMPPITDRWARACVTSQYPTYPTSGNVFWAELGNVEPSTTSLNATASESFTAYDPQVAVRVTGYDATLPAENDVVRIVWRNGEWCYDPNAAGEEPFYVRNEYSNLTAGRGLELGTLYSAGVVSADLRDDNTRAYCVLAEDIDANAIGRAKVSGWTTARVDVTDVDHTHCYLPRGATIFKSNFGGPLELCQTPATATEQNLLVRFQPLYRRRFTLQEAIASVGSSGNSAIIADQAGAQVTLGYVEAWFNWMTGTLTSVPAYVSGWVTWCDDAEKWIIDSMECNT